jgi:hypothetical protein
MKIFLLLPFVSLLWFSDYSSINFSRIIQTDTTIVAHQLDGQLTEWQQEKFASDKSTQIRFAIDNDSEMLFLALQIPDKLTQQKIMQKGLSLFVDIKGRKKENRGVEFPLGMENNPNIEMMKVFGFTGESLPQNIRTEGSLNIALAWDSAYVLSIEYNVPLKILNGTLQELNNKTISIGWKINEGEQMPGNSVQPVSSTSRVVSVPAGSRPSTNRNTGPGRNESIQQPNTTKAHTIWSDHTIIF